MTAAMKTILAIAAFCCAVLSGAYAQSNRVDTEFASSIFLPEKTAFVPGETLWLAFAQKLEPGWHVYWKKPGAIPVCLSICAGSCRQDLRRAKSFYPTPERILIGPLANFGHHGDPVLFGFRSTVAETVVQGQATLSVNATWLICEEICVPEDGSVYNDAGRGVRCGAPQQRAPRVGEGGARASTPEPLDAAATFADGDTITLSLDAPGWP